jgi:hypothetical protein
MQEHPKYFSVIEEIVSHNHITTNPGRLTVAIVPSDQIDIALAISQCPRTSQYKIGVREPLPADIIIYNPSKLERRLGFVSQESEKAIVATDKIGRIPITLNFGTQIEITDTQANNRRIGIVQITKSEQTIAIEQHPGASRWLQNLRRTHFSPHAHKSVIKHISAFHQVKGSVYTIEGTTRPVVWDNGQEHHGHEWILARNRTDQTSLQEVTLSLQLHTPDKTTVRYSLFNETTCLDEQDVRINYQEGLITVPSNVSVVTIRPKGSSTTSYIYMPNNRILEL